MVFLAISVEESRSTRTSNVWRLPRGGEGGKKRKRRRKSTDKKQPKTVVNEVLKETDAAQNLGNAIRERSDLVKNGNPSVQSISFAMGSSDYQIPSSSVIASYFLKSHGGAHGLQSMLSLLSSISGIFGVLLLNLNLLKRCLQFALTKYVAGLLAGSVIVASNLPELGFRSSKETLSELASDPISQYLFYTACILFWLPAKGLFAKKGQILKPEWWQTKRSVFLILSLPILLREVISSILVVSDVLVIFSVTNRPIQGVLRVFGSFVNIFMSLLVSPSVWRNADAKSRQAIVAKLTSRLSLLLEVAVGVILMTDFILQFSRLLFGVPAIVNGGLTRLIKCLICTNLYLRFLYTRRRKIRKIGTRIRGGAVRFPLYVLGVVLNPRESMGLGEEMSLPENLQTILGF